MNTPCPPQPLRPLRAWRCPICGASHRQAVEYCRRCHSPLLLILATQHYAPNCTQQTEDN